MISDLSLSDALLILVCVASVSGGAYFALAIYLDARKRSEQDGRSAVHGTLLADIIRLRAENEGLRAERNRLSAKILRLERELFDLEGLLLEQGLIALERMKLAPPGEGEPEPA